MPNKSAKSNEEIAREIALISVPMHDASHEIDYGPYCMVCEPREGELFDKMILAIEAAISSAQSSLAEKVLAQVADERDEADCEYSRAYNDAIRDVDASLRDLFTRLGIKTSGDEATGN